MTTKDVIGKLIRPGAGVKRWMIVILLGGVFISLGIVVLDWSLGGSRLINVFLDAFKRISENIVLPFWFLALIGWVIVALGTMLAISGAYQATISMIKLIALPNPALKKAIGPKIVVFGGGSGIHPVLKALKTLDVQVTAVVTIADSGGSTGRLRDEFGMLAPGDIRRCLLALSEQPLLDKLMRYRFDSRTSLDGHSMGNLMLTVLTETEGDFAEAVYRLSKLLAAKGAVIPFTIDDVSLCAKYEDGSVICGEANIPKCKKKIKNVFFNPPYAKPFVRVMEAVNEADFIIVGPGSLYTSIMPTLLLTPIVDTISRSNARKIYISNIMTEPGETDGFSLGDHLEAIKRHTNASLFDMVLLSDTEIPQEVISRYSKTGAQPVEDIGIPDSKVKVLFADLAMLEEDLVRHSETKLARVLGRIVKSKNG
jgi:uncharacterized cofD-like protein